MINRKFQIFLFISVCIIWGTTWMAMKIAVLTVPPILATGLRFLIASPVLFLLAYIYKQPILFPKGTGKWVIILSLAYFAIPFTLMIYGEKYISSGLGAIIFANMPIFVMLSSLLFLNMKLSKHQVFGLLLGIVSVSAILFRELNITGASYFIGIGSLILAVIIQAVIYVLYLITIKLQLQLHSRQGRRVRCCECQTVFLLAPIVQINETNETNFCFIFF